MAETSSFVWFMQTRDNLRTLLVLECMAGFFFATGSLVLARPRGILSCAGTVEFKNTWFVFCTVSQGMFICIYSTATCAVLTFPRTSYKYLQTVTWTKESSIQHPFSSVH